MMKCGKVMIDLSLPIKKKKTSKKSKLFYFLKFFLEKKCSSAKDSSFFIVLLISTLFILNCNYNIYPFPRLLSLSVPHY